MNAADAAVEAAAEWLPHSGDCEVRPERDCTCWQSRVDLMRNALEAAAPHIASQALREASAAYPLETAYGGAEHAVNWLNDRAEHIEAVPTGAASLVPKENQ